MLRAEAAHFAKKAGIAGNLPATSSESQTPKRQLEDGPDADGSAEVEDLEAKRRRILEETRDIDADSDGGDSESSEEDRLVVPTTDHNFPR